MVYRYYSSSLFSSLPLAKSMQFFSVIDSMYIKSNPATSFVFSDNTGTTYEVFFKNLIHILCSTSSALSLPRHDEATSIK